MNSRPLELLVLFASLVKWLVFASVVGVLVGLSTTLFLKTLNLGLQAADTFSYALYLLPIGLLISGWITFTLSPEAQGHGTERVVHALHFRSGNIPFSVVPAKLAATLLTISAGGSAGNVGPCAQIGAGLCSLVAKTLRIREDDRKKLVICGLSAGFSAVFGTPVAGALFGAEVLFISQFSYSALFPSIVSALVACHVAAFLGIDHLEPSLMIAMPAFNLSLFLSLALAGLLFGACAFLFIEIMRFTSRMASHLSLAGPLKGAIGGVLLLIIAVVFSTSSLGLGYESLQQALAGEKMPGYGFLVKMMTTSITLSFGGSGGIILPLCVVGATVGATMAEWLNLEPALLAAVGLVALLAGAVNIPLTAIVLAMELFGSSMAPYAALTCAIAYLVSGHRSMIPTQILAESKSSSLHIERGKTIDEVRTTTMPPDLRSMLKHWMPQSFKRKSDKEHDNR